MPHNRLFKILSLTLVACALSLTACDKSEDATATAPQTHEHPSWMLDAAPEGSVEVAQAKADGKEGDPIVLVGKIGGRTKPISAESGLFVIMDTSVPSCADMEGDHCETPWDYCCETPESITANAATIQLRDTDGKPITLAEGDLKPLSQVAVVGTVAPRPNSDTLVIHATGVHVMN